MLGVAHDPGAVETEEVDVEVPVDVEEDVMDVVEVVDVVVVDETVDVVFVDDVEGGRH